MGKNCINYSTKKKKQNNNKQLAMCISVLHESRSKPWACYILNQWLEKQKL